MKKKYLLLFVALISISISYSQEFASVLKGSLWNKRKISVCWDNPTPENLTYRLMVQQSVKDTWEYFSQVQFTDWCPASEKNADIHIFINDDGPHVKLLGNKIKNMPQGMVLNFTFQNWCPECLDDKEFSIKAIAVHEFGHVLGFAHEQNRKDCAFPNCFNKEQGEVGDWTLSACDLSSIMNYCNPHWNNSGFLSDKDIEALQFLYGKSNNMSYFSKDIEIAENAVYVDQVKNIDRYNFNIYLAGEEKDLDKIESVKFNLSDAGDSFVNKIIVSNEKDSNFGIKLDKVYGDFDIEIQINYKDKKTPSKKFIHTLTISDGLLEKKARRQKSKLKI